MTERRTTELRTMAAARRSRVLVSPTMLAIVITALFVPAASATELAVKVENLSTPVLCAEEDNVTLTLSAPKVRRFRIEAVHPAYLAGLKDDNWAADWTACSFGPTAETKSAEPSPAEPKSSASPSAAATSAQTSPAEPPAPPQNTPERITLHETVGHWLIGLKFPNFWRKAETTVRVGDKVHRGLHLLQLWRVRPNGGEEVLVLYPQDGYWRARPLAPPGRDLTAFGSSFLIGPVEQAERPIVRLTEVAYDSAKGAFDLTFAAGGQARVGLAEVSAIRTALDVTFTSGVPQKPFAALRSMYVSGYNNDVAAVALRGKDGWTEATILSFTGATTPELWAGRHTISRHNTSSPDMLFKNFRE